MFGTPIGTATRDAMLMTELDNTVSFRPDVKGAGLIAGINMIAKDQVTIVRD